MNRIGVMVLSSALLVACSRQARPPATAPATVSLGSCADPERDGVIGGSPRLRRADRDLDGDGKREAVVADGDLCSEEGNCHWNLFHQPAGAGQCWRYIGTIGAAHLEPQAHGSGEGFRDLGGWWSFGKGGRFLRQEYRFRHGAYRLVDTLLCRQQEDDRVLCASDASGVQQ